MTEHYFILNEPQEKHLYKKIESFYYRDFNLLNFINLIQAKNKRVIGLSFEDTEHNITIHAIEKEVDQT